MALHPDLRAALAAAPPPYSQMPIAQVRELVNQRILAAPKRNSTVAAVQDRAMPGPAGPLNLRIYVPESTPPFPVILLFHGGGWVLGTLDTHDDLCRSLCHAAGALVVSVDYRLAPEAKFPAPFDDCYAALQWSAQHVAEMGGDPARTTVSGDSAGGNLAAAVALKARDGQGPRVASQVLIYPITDQNFDTPSYFENATGYGLTRETMMYYWKSYLAHPDDAANPYASPLRAKTLAGLPPALIITAQYDPLRDEGLAMAARLSEAGVPVRCTNYPDMNHGFLAFGANYPSAQLALEEIASFVKSAHPPD